VTETEWNSCNDPNAMLEYIQNRASERKLRLFGAACCRRVWRLMTDPRHRRAVEAAERLADGLITEERFKEIHQPVMAMWAKLPSCQEDKWEPSHYMTGAATHVGTGGGAEYAASFAARGLAYDADPDHGPGWTAVRQAEARIHCELIRDLFGSPNAPYQFEADWLAGDGRSVAARAGEIYRDGDFDSLSSLADELEQAGCRDRVVLEHCRRPEPHTRGCWVIDALMGRETAVHAGLMTEADWQTCANPYPLLHFLRDKGSNRKWRLFAVACCRRIERLMTDERSRRAVEVAAEYADDVSKQEELEAARSAAQGAEDEAKRVLYEAKTPHDKSCRTPACAALSSRYYAAAAACGAVCRDTRCSDAEPDSYEYLRWEPSHRCAAEAVSRDIYVNSKSAKDGSGYDDARGICEAAHDGELRAHCQLLRDLFGEFLGPPGDKAGGLHFQAEVGRLKWLQVEKVCQLPTPRVLDLSGDCLTWNDGAVVKFARSLYDEEAFDRLPLLADLLAEAGCADAAILAHCHEPGPHMKGCWVVDLLIGRE
jgi:hypothetical protein